jgi:hypothetical protein
MTKNTNQSSPEIANLAALTMNDPKASQIAKKLAASVLSQAKFGKQTGVDLQTIASRVLQSPKYSADTKSLAASVLSQSTKDR